MPAIPDSIGRVRSTMFMHFSSVPGTKSGPLPGPPRPAVSILLLLGGAVMPGEHAGLDGEKNPVQHIADHGERDHAGKHLPDLESALGGEHEIADAVRGRDHLADHHDD